MDSLKVTYRLDQIFCFKCKHTFTWRKSEAPAKCVIGKHDWEIGMFARPDFLIYGTEHDEYPLAIVRIDGPVHDRKAQRVKDRFQAQDFIDAGIKVFLIRNEWLLGAEHIVGRKLKKWVPTRLPDWIYTAMAWVVVECAHNDDLYKRYLSDKDVRHYLGI